MSEHSEVTVSGGTPVDRGDALPERFENPGLPPHKTRVTDRNPAAARSATLRVAALFGISALGSIGFVVAYALAPEDGTVAGVRSTTLFLGLGLFLAMFGIGAAAIQWARTLMSDHEVAEDRHPQRTSDADRAAAVEVLRQGAEDSGIARRGVLKGALFSALALAPLAVPILPAEVFLAYQERLGIRPAALERHAQSVLPQTYADMHGWHELVEGVAAVYRTLTPDERERVAVFGQNYGVASAVEVLGPAHGLPRGLAFSGHNNFWFWGLPPGRGDPLLVVGRPDEDCGGLYRQWDVALQLPRTPYVMPYEDAHALTLCRGARAPLTGIPPALRHFE